MKHKFSVVVLVFNDKNELALQLRAAHDDNYPLHWDFSAAGGIDIGENHLAAAQRELKEEIGIESSLVYLGEELYQDETGTDKLYIYRTKHNGPFQIQVAEVERVEFFSLEKIQKMLETGTKFHPEFPFIWSKKKYLLEH